MPTPPPKEFSRRLRKLHVIPETDGDIVYDLERTFVLKQPKALTGLYDANHPALRKWLIDKDLLTLRNPPDWADLDVGKPPQITDVSLDLPGACNMGCTYCFEKPINSRIGRMSEETMLASLDFAFKQAAGAEIIAIHFGSGEPLIEMELLRKLVTEANSRAASAGQKVSYELTTNATLVTDDIAAFLAAHPFNIRVSCDGPAEVHNKNRPMLNGRNSYDKVVRGLKILLNHLPDRLTVNAVVCSKTRLIDFYNWAQELGIRHFHTIKVGSDKSAPETLRATELKDYKQDLQTICDILFERLENGEVPMDYQPITKCLRRLMIPAPITRFCGVASLSGP